MNIFGKVLIWVFGMIATAFVVIGLVSIISKGGFWDLYREWFNVAEKVVETVPSENGGAVATVAKTVKTILTI